MKGHIFVQNWNDSIIFGKKNNVSDKLHGASEIRKRVNGKPGFTLGDSPDGIKLLILGATCPIGSTEVEKAASGIRRL